LLCWVADRGLVRSLGSRGFWTLGFPLTLGSCSFIGHMTIYPDGRRHVADPDICARALEPDRLSNQATPALPATIHLILEWPCPRCHMQIKRW
jgi:hypothetical protein